MYLLRKRTVEVCMSNLTIGPQEPRRPRFPFFHLHNVKERTSGASFEGDVMEAGLPNFGEQDFASGYPAAYLPYQKIADRRAARPSASARRVIWLTIFAVNTRK